MFRLTFLCVLCTLAYGAQVDVPMGTAPPMRMIPKLYVTRDFSNSCFSQCFSLPIGSPVGSTMACVQQCAESLVHSIEDWLEDLPNVPDIKSNHDQRSVYNKLYVDGTNLQQQLLALQRATQRPGGILDALFPNLPSFGIFRPPSNVQQGFESRPQYPGLVMQVIQTVTDLLAQVIKKQQDILQVIIGCSCNETTTTTTMAPMTSPGQITTTISSSTTTGGSTTPTTPVTTAAPSTTTIAAGR